MTASVAGRFAKTRVKNLFQSPDSAAEERERSNRAAGRRIAETLGELKGAVMKVGQMASIASDILPAEFSDALSKLQKEAPPMDFEVIAQQIESELGESPDRLFANFERKPFAAASIGQVHRARTDDGRDVVVKVQYPGIDGAVDSDLNQLKLALRASGMLRVSRQALDAGFHELRDRLHEELDYCNEADNVRSFGDFHRQHRWMVIPEVIAERSAKRVLTLTYVGGDSTDTLGRCGYNQDTRDRIGAHLLTMMCSQIFEYGRIHGDPNPGNLAVRKDGSIVLYDFGCVKTLKPEIVQHYRNVMISGIDENYEGVERSLLGLGLRRLAGPKPGTDYYKAWRDAIAPPFLRHEPYDFSTADIHERLVKLIPRAMKHLNSFQVAKEMLFLDRMVGGHYGNLKTIGARVCVPEILFPHLEADSMKPPWRAPHPYPSRGESPHG